MKVKEESEKAGLKLNIQKTKIMESSPITSWQIDGEIMETVTDFIFLGYKITVDSNCSLEMKRYLLLGRKTMINIDSVLKVKTLLCWQRVPKIKAMFFSVVIYRCETWTIKKTEWQRIDAFKFQWWRRLLRVPWTARRSNQSTLKEIDPEIHWKDWCWSWGSNILVFWWEELTHWKDSDAGKDWRQEEKGAAEDEIVGWHNQLKGEEFHQTGRWWRTGKPSVLTVHEVTKSWTLLNDV